MFPDITLRSRVHDVKSDWKPSFFSNEEFTYLLMEALETFLMVFSANGQVVYVSESVTPLLGHKPVSRHLDYLIDLECDEPR